MDEKKLAELFQDAVRDVPPASFDHGDIRAASARATARRRTGIVTGSALAFVLLCSGTVATIALSGGPGTPEVAMSAPENGAGSANSGTMTPYDTGSGPTAQAEEPSPQQPVPPETPKQGGSLSGRVGPSADSTPSGCGQADRELAAALAGELPAAAGRPELPVPFSCPEGSRGASVHVTDGARSGTVSIVLLPKGMMTFTAIGSEVPGSVPSSAEAPHSGGTLYVVAQPDQGSTAAPFGDNVGNLAATLGKRY